MTPAELNLVLACIITGLALYIGFSHLRERGVRHPLAYIGLTILVLSFVGIVTAIPPALRLPASEREPFAFIAAFMRSVALILLGGYALHRWADK